LPTLHSCEARIKFKDVFTPLSKLAQKITGTHAEVE
jgi:hypothetical protein